MKPAYALAIFVCMGLAHCNQNKDLQGEIMKDFEGDTVMGQKLDEAGTSQIPVPMKGTSEPSIAMAGPSQPFISEAGPSIYQGESSQPFISEAGPSIYQGESSQPSHYESVVTRLSHAFDAGPRVDENGQPIDPNTPYTVPLIDPELKDLKIPDSAKIYKNLEISAAAARYLYEPFKIEENNSDSSIQIWLNSSFNKCFHDDLHDFARDDKCYENSYAALSAVIFWAEHYNDVTPPYKYKDDTGKLVKYAWTPEQQDFFSKDNCLLFPLLRAAHFMRVYGLLNILVEYLGCRLRGKHLHEFRLELALPWERENIQQEINNMKGCATEARTGDGAGTSSQTYAETSVPTREAIKKLKIGGSDDTVH